MSQNAVERKQHIDKATPLSVVRQCELLEVHRSGLYYQPVPETTYNLELMRLIDEKHMLHPWLGVPRMTQWLRLDKGYPVNHKRVERLYGLLGIQASGPKPNTSKPGKGHKIYPYLLRHLVIDRPNQVWAMDITYIPVQGGYLYLVAVIDLYSRYVLNWSLSNSMTSRWCKQTLDEAIQQFGKPEIINTDQGSQFTAEEFSLYVTNDLEIRLSMDGKGRAIDNIFIERLWRSVKYEHVYLFPASDGLECYQGLKTYFKYYNDERRHQSLEDKTPLTVFQQSEEIAA
jgi:putative transposase